MSEPLIPSYRPDGSVMDLAAVTREDIDWRWIAASLSKLARWNGSNEGPPLSVAQHCVQGADALWAETRDLEIAGAFLLHDAHEWRLGDIVTPAADLLSHYAAAMLPETPGRPCGRLMVPAAIAMAKQALDEAIYAEAGIACPRDMPRERWRAVAEMDRRMARAEALALFGPAAGAHAPGRHLPPVETQEPVAPAWDRERAEAAWLARLGIYLGAGPQRHARPALGKGAPE